MKTVYILVLALAVHSASAFGSCVPSLRVLFGDFRSAVQQDYPDSVDAFANIAANLPETITKCLGAEAATGYQNIMPRACTEDVAKLIKVLNRMQNEQDDKIRLARGTCTSMKTP